MSLLQTYNPIKRALQNTEVYDPTDEVKQFLLDTYYDVEQDLQLQSETNELLNTNVKNEEVRNLLSFWRDCRRDYAVYVPLRPTGDWKRMYRRPIARDKANTIISQLTQNYIYPQCIAQNPDQQIDRVISRVGRACLEHALMNDGRPTYSGFRTQCDAVHQTVIEGTAHLQVDMVDGVLKTEVIPNEEVLIPNYWQPDEQKQAHFIRFQNPVHYVEAEAEFGDLPNFKKYVKPGNAGNWDLGNVNGFLRNVNVGLLSENEVHIVRVWRPVPKDKLTKGRKEERYFNVIINGVLMFDPENKSPYKHGKTPVVKIIHEKFNNKFYWGNSLTNKARPDNALYDSYYTVAMNKGIQSLGRPLVSLNGRRFSEEITVPFTITPVPDKEVGISKVDGLGDPPTQAEINLMNIIERSIDNSTASPQVAGQAGTGTQTATETITLQQNAQKLLGAFGNEIGFAMEALAYQVVKLTFQFYPRKKINELAEIQVPNQQLSNGRKGTLSVMFKSLKPMSKSDYLEESRALLRGEEEALDLKEPKESIYINKDILDNIDWYFTFHANALLQKSDALERAEAAEDYAQLLSNPLINQEENVRRMIRRRMPDADEDTLIAQQPIVPPGEEAEEPELAGAMTRSVTNLARGAAGPKGLPL